MPLEPSNGPRDRLKRRLKRHGPALLAFLLSATVVVLSGKVLLPKATGTFAVPDGVYLQGIVVGLLTSLLAIGLILVYRTSRIVNFAQAALGAVAATLAAELMVIFHVPYAAAVPIGIAAGVGLSLLTEWAFIRRFAKAPRVLVTVATIVFAQFLAIAELAPIAFNPGTPVLSFAVFKTPFGGTFTFGGVNFSADHVIVLVGAPLVLAGLALFFAKARYGIAARAAAENEDRVRLVGCSVKRLSLVVWGIAGLLSSLAAILRAPILGPQFEAFQGPDMLVRALAAAVIAGMESLPAAVAASLVITGAERTIFFATGASGLADALLLGIVLLGLVVQRERFAHIKAELSTWRFVEGIRPFPRALAGVQQVRWARLTGRAALVVGTLALPVFMTETQTNLLSVVLVFAMAGVSLVVLTGWAGNISFGQWAIVGVGALVAQKIASHPTPPDFFLILLVAGLCGALTCALIGVPALRVRGLLLGVTTLAFALAATNWVFQWKILISDEPIVRPWLFGVFDLSGERAFYYVTLGGLVFVLFAARNLRRSRWGRNLIATRDNERQAQALGVRPALSRLGAFAISGFIAGLAGAFYAYIARSIEYTRFDPTTSLVLFTMAVIGGMGSLAGPVLGALFVRGSQYFLPYELQVLLRGFGLLACLVLFQGGLAQVFTTLRDRYLAGVAERAGIFVPELRPGRAPPTTPPETAEGNGAHTYRGDDVVVIVEEKPA